MTPEELAALVGGTAGPDPAPEPQANPIAQALAKLVAGYQAWARQHGGAGDPLAARQTPDPYAGADSHVAPSLVRFTPPADAGPVAAGLGQVAQVNQRAGSARQGQAFQEFDLGNNRFAHVYFGPDGKRRVFKFRR